MDTDNTEGPVGPHGESDPSLAPESVKLTDGRTRGATTTTSCRTKPAVRQRVGIYGLVVVFGGIPIQLAIMSFLGYLWSQQQHNNHDGDDPNQRVWRTIVLNTWMATTITLSSVLIRFIIGAQLVLCTALAAGLILETSSAPFEDAPRLSLLRANNSGPSDIVRLMIGRFPPSLGLSLPHVLVVVLYFTGLALQFSSTLLVSDLGDITIQSDPESRQMAIIETSGALVKTNGDFMWAKSPGIWSTYAEARNGTGTVSENMTDTGTILRAFLPFESRDRLLLRYYDGLAVTQEIRTICVPAELNEETSGMRIADGSDQLLVNGTVSASMEPFTAAGFRFPGQSTNGNGTGGMERLTDAPFSCPFYNVQGGEGVEGVKLDKLALAICHFVSSGGGQRFLLINAVGSYLDWYDYLDTGFRRTSTENGWATYTPTGPSTEHHDGLRLSVSVCGVRYNHIVQDITASTPFETQEFPLQWDNSTQRWNTSSILRLLGVVGDPSDLKSRGILSLDSHTPANDSTVVSIISDRPSDSTTTAMHIAFDASLTTPGDGRMTYFGNPANRTIVFCTRCVTGTQSNNNAHPASVLLMGAALNATNSPAAALDDLWATWAQILYSSAVGQFDGAGQDNSTIIWAQTVTTPIRWRGFIAMAALLLCHIVIMVAMTALFVVRTAHSFHGDLWPAIAQAAAGEQVREILDDAATMPDYEVNKIIKERRLNGVAMCTGVDATTGRVGLVRARSSHE